MRKTINLSASLEQIKRDARRLQQGTLALHAARDLAARAQGYENWRHAINLHPGLSRYDGDHGIDRSREHVIPVPGCYLVFPKDPAHCDYVRFVSVDLEELLYWDVAEWRDDPVGVVGAILKAYEGGLSHHPDIASFEPTDHDHAREPVRPHFGHEALRGVRIKGGFVALPMVFVDESFLAVFNEQRQEVYRWIFGEPRDSLAEMRVRAEPRAGVPQGWLDEPARVMAQLMHTLRSGVQPHVPDTALVQCFQAEFDPRFRGGDYYDVGRFVSVPIVPGLDSEEAFEQATGWPASCLIHYESDEDHFARVPQMGAGVVAGRGMTP